MNADILHSIVTDPGFAIGYFGAMFNHWGEVIQSVFALG